VNVDATKSTNTLKSAWRIRDTHLYRCKQGILAVFMVNQLSFHIAGWIKHKFSNRVAVSSCLLHSIALF